jgi:hypothetical protein
MLHIYKKKKSSLLIDIGRLRRRERRRSGRGRAGRDASRVGNGARAPTKPILFPCDFFFGEGGVLPRVRGGVPTAAGCVRTLERGPTGRLRASRKLQVAGMMHR